MKLIHILTIFMLCSFANAQSATSPLPNIPAQILTAEDISALLKDDTEVMWENYSKQTQEKALDLIKKQLYPEAMPYLYISEIAKVFSQQTSVFPAPLKKIMLSDIPALCDLFESIKEQDSIEGFCDALATLYNINPVKVEKFIRCAYAVALIYDLPPGQDWPLCNVAKNPLAFPFANPEIVFNMFVEKPEDMLFSLDKLTISELIFVFGIAGPVEELTQIRRTNITPFSIEKISKSTKIDKSRIDPDKKNSYLEWDQEKIPFTAFNILKEGGTSIEYIYAAWRVANANGLPCLYYTSNDSDSKTKIAWLAYMARPGLWKYNVARSSSAEYVFARPINPQTWEEINQYDVNMIERRYITTKNGIYAYAFSRIADIYLAKNELDEATYFSKKAIKENPEYSKPYETLILSRAMAGATAIELDFLWKKSYESFRRYPDKMLKLLAKYRANLILRGNSKEADRLFVAEMRGVMRDDPSLGLLLASSEINKMYSRADNKKDVLPLYQMILKGASSLPDKYYDKIAKPLADKFSKNEDFDTSEKIMTMFLKASRSKDYKDNVNKYISSLEAKERALNAEK